MEPPNHPAKFSESIMDILRAELALEQEHRGHDDLVVLDPFAGTGRVHLLAGPGIYTRGIEIEPEWAAMHERTICGDSRKIRWADATFDAIVTSPTYGNRMADHHNAKDGSKRFSYRHVLGRALTEGNSGMMQWGKPYRDLHSLVWLECNRVLKPGGIILLNISDHIRKNELVGVTDWHVTVLTSDFGFNVEAWERIPTRRMKMGANRNTRVEHESVIKFRRPT